MFCMLFKEQIIVSYYFLMLFNCLFFCYTVLESFHDPCELSDKNLKSQRQCCGAVRPELKPQGVAFLYGVVAQNY
jgi:hypothetical protein